MPNEKISGHEKTLTKMVSASFVERVKGIEQPSNRTAKKKKIALRLESYPKSNEQTFFFSSLSPRGDEEVTTIQ